MRYTSVRLTTETHDRCTEVHPCVHLHPLALLANWELLIISCETLVQLTAYIIARAHLQTSFEITLGYITHMPLCRNPK